MVKMMDRLPGRTTTPTQNTGDNQAPTQTRSRVLLDTPPEDSLKMFHPGNNQATAQTRSRVLLDTPPEDSLNMFHPGNNQAPTQTRNRVRLDTPPEDSLNMFHPGNNQATARTRSRGWLDDDTVSARSTRPLHLEIRIPVRVMKVVNLMVMVL